MTPASTQTEKIDSGWDGLGARDGRYILPDEPPAVRTWAAIKGQFSEHPHYKPTATEEDRVRVVQAALDALET